MPTRTGSEYVESLRDGRRVWISGAEVDDVPGHPAFAGAVETLASAYDLQHTEGFRDLLTQASPDGADRVGRTFAPPRSAAELSERRRVVETYHRESGGMMGRLPEYGTSFAVGLLSLGASLPVDGAGERIEAWFDSCRERDACIVSSFVDPQVDRLLPSAQSGLLHIVEHRDDGIVISGCKSVATLGPGANEFLIMTAPRPFAGPDDVIYAAVPPNSPGLRFFCREPFAPGRERRDAPLSSRFDEPDAWALFDNVFVPSDRVFFTGRDVDLAAVGGYFEHILSWPWFHNLIRVAAKAELISGVCRLLAEYLNTWQFPQVQEAVAETVEYAHAINAFIRAGEVESAATESGIFMAAPAYMQVAKVYAVKNYPRMLEIVRELAGQGIIMAPRGIDLDEEEIGPLVRSYYGAAGVAADDRIKLFRLAWDLACDSFAGRQLLFELFNAGGLAMSKLAIANGIDPSESIALTKRLAAIEDQAA
jgi:4-hydroxyphenylacetate 3-monooxygenase